VNAARPGGWPGIACLITASALLTACATSTPGTGPEAGPDPATGATPMRTTDTDESVTRTAGGAASGQGGTAVWTDPDADLRPAIRVEEAPPVAGDLVLRAPDSPLPAGFPVWIEASVGPEGQPWPDPIAWSSSDRTVLRVSDSGVVTGLAPGSALITATSAPVTAEIRLQVIPDQARILTVSPAAANALSGEVVHFTASVRSVTGVELDDGRVHWSTTPIEGGRSARVEPDGAFVAPAPGSWLVTAARGSLSSSAIVAVTPRQHTTTLQPIAAVPLPPDGGPAAGVRVFEGIDGRDWAWVWTDDPARIHVLDITDPEHPRYERSMDPGANRVHDLEIGGGNAWAIVAVSGAADSAGLLVLDLSLPATPRPQARLNDGLAGGASAVAVDHDHVWAGSIEDGTLVGFDLSDPDRPVRIAGWRASSRDTNAGYISDIDAGNGIALLARWHDGLTVLDIGAGISGGTAARPALVSEYRYRVRRDGREWGNTLRVRRWRDWVLLGDGIDGCTTCVDGPRGGIRVLDVTEIRRPREVARYEVPEAGIRDFQVDHRTETLIAAFGTGGLRLADLSGELRGELYGQGREISATPTGAWHDGIPSRSLARGARVLKQAVFVADMYAGLRVFRIESQEE
jgi:hypothetical protein